jgi:chaperonin GroEL
LAGDGTTTATVLAQAIVKRIEKRCCRSKSMDLKRGIDKAVQAIVTDLAKQSKVVGTDSDKIKQIASISANNDEVIGDL